MQRSTLVTGIVVAIAILVVAYFFFFSNVQLFGQQPGQSAQTASSTQLIVQDESVGTGATAEPGDTVTVNYIGRLQDGTVFDTTQGRQPFSFTLGQGQVIPGWDQGLVGMKVGGKRLLIIPPMLAYGANQVGPIPANSTLVFEVDLLSVAQGSTTPVAPEGASAQ